MHRLGNGQCTLPMHSFLHLPPQSPPCCCLPSQHTLPRQSIHLATSTLAHDALGLTNMLAVPTTNCCLTLPAMHPMVNTLPAAAGRSQQSLLGCVPAWLQHGRCYSTQDLPQHAAACSMSLLHLLLRRSAAAGSRSCAAACQCFASAISSVAAGAGGGPAAAASRSTRPPCPAGAPAASACCTTSCADVLYRC